MNITIDDRKRFLAKVEFGDCWKWQAHKNWKGYGKFKLDGKMERAHRIMYQWIFGPIPKGLTIDHLCQTRDCVRPSHLECVTPKENINRGDTGKQKVRRKRRIICIHQKPCRECRLASQRQHYNEWKMRKSSTPIKPPNMEP